MVIISCLMYIFLKYDFFEFISAENYSYLEDYQKTRCGKAKFFSLKKIVVTTSWANGFKITLK